MKLISVLGTGDYGECKYKLNRKESVSCCFIQTSLNSLENFDRTFLFLTKAAKQKNFEKLKQEFEKFSIKTNIEGIDIPDGRNEGELWDIFEIIEENIEEKEEVWFDITHSFRSIPLIFFLLGSIYNLSLPLSFPLFFYPLLQRQDSA